MFVLLAVLGVIALASISAVFIEVARDGYHRIPQRALVRIF